MKIGGSFSTKQDLKNALLIYNSTFGCNITTLKSGKPVYMVSHYDDRHCIPTRQARSTFGFKEIIPLFRLKIKDCPSYFLVEMVKDLKCDCNLDADYQACHRAREVVLASINGELRANYTLLKKFLFVFEKKNPSSFVRVEDSDGVFVRAFAAPAACVAAFERLRPLVSVNGTHIRSLTKEILLCAAGLDCLGQVVPLCYALVDVKCFEKWGWFFCCFKQAFAIDDVMARDLTLLSNRQKGLANAVVTRFPLSAHGMCVYHLKENLKRRMNKQLLSDKVFLLAKAKTSLQYEEILDEIGEVSDIAHPHLAEVDKAHFVDAFSLGRRFGQYISNISESLNATILPKREEFPFQAFQGLVRKYAEVFLQRQAKCKEVAYFNEYGRSDRARA